MMQENQTGSHGVWHTHRYELSAPKLPLKMKKSVKLIFGLESLFLPFLLSVLCDRKKKHIRIFSLTEFMQAVYLLVFMLTHPQCAIFLIKQHVFLVLFNKKFYVLKPLKDDFSSKITETVSMNSKKSNSVWAVLCGSCSPSTICR